jgi:hypothetical protein
MRIRAQKKLYSFALALLTWLSMLVLVLSGHEVLYDVKLDPGVDILPHELAIIQFDSRALDSYWNVSAHWNFAYAMQHGNQYAYFTLKANTECSNKNFALSPAWCKVKAMLHAQRHLPSAKAFIYLDSDAVITTQLNYTLTDVLAYMRQDLNWDINKQPIAFNQDGPGWACVNTLETTRFDFCLNSGTVFWRRSFISQRVLADWWDTGRQPYDKDKFQFTQAWRSVWPWEQGPMHSIYEKYRGFIMRLSFPKLTHLPWTSLKKPTSQYPTDFVEPWCFSHWPGANCFITHFCASMNQKKRMMREYVISSERIKGSTMNVFTI